MPCSYSLWETKPDITVCPMLWHNMFDYLLQSKDVTASAPNAYDVSFRTTVHDWTCVVCHFALKHLISHISHTLPRNRVSALFYGPLCVGIITSKTDNADWNVGTFSVLFLYLCGVFLEVGDMNGTFFLVKSSLQK